jgi:hypothetical protein
VVNALVLGKIEAMRRAGGLVDGVPRKARIENLPKYQVDTSASGLEKIKVQYKPARVQRWQLVSLIPQPVYRAEREALLRIQCERWAKRQAVRARFSSGGAAMYLDWKPGVRLVCVDATPPPLAALWFFRSWIRSGQSYTLRQLIIPLPGGPNPGPGVYLAEIRNPIEPESGFEYGYLAYRFEKLEEGTVALPARGEPASDPREIFPRGGSPARGGGTLENGPTAHPAAPSTTSARRTRLEASTCVWGAFPEGVCDAGGSQNNHKRRA